MKKVDLVEWIIENGNYLLTVKNDSFKINLYQVHKDYWEVYFNVSLNRVSRVGRVTEWGMKKYLNLLDFDLDRD